MWGARHRKEDSNVRVEVKENIRRSKHHFSVVWRRRIKFSKAARSKVAIVDSNLLSASTDDRRLTTHRCYRNRLSPTRPKISIPPTEDRQPVFSGIW